MIMVMVSEGPPPMAYIHAIYLTFPYNSNLNLGFEPILTKVDRSREQFLWIPLKNAGRLSQRIFYDIYNLKGKIKSLKNTYF